MAYSTASHTSAETHARIAVRTLLAVGFTLQLFIPIVVGSSTAAGALSWVLASLIFFVIPALLLVPSAGELPLSRLLLLAFIPPAIFIGVANLLNGKVDARAITDMTRSLYFFFAFVCGARMATDRAFLEHWFARVFRWILVLLLLYLIAAFVLRDLIDDLELLYGKLDNAVSGRIFLPFPNPYDLALFCTLPIFYHLLAKQTVLALLWLLILIATQSRTGVVLLLIGLIVCALQSRPARQQMLKAVLLVLVAIGALFTFVIDLDDVRSFYLIANTIGLFEGQSTTLSRRFAQWLYLYDLPILGWGTIRSTDLVIENGIIYELYRTGILGVYSIVCFYVFPLIIALKVLWAETRTALHTAFALFVVLTTVALGSSVFIYQPKMSLIYWFATGILYSILRQGADARYAVSTVGPDSRTLRA